MKKKRLDQMVAARSQLNEAKARREKQEEMNHMVSHALKDFEKERNKRESCRRRLAEPLHVDRIALPCDDFWFSHL